MTSTDQGRLWRFVNHPWIVRVIGGAIAGVLAAIVVGHLYGSSRTPAPTPSLSPTVVIKVSVTPDLLSLASKNRSVSISATGLTPNSAAGIEIADPGGGGTRGTATTTSSGELVDTQTLVGPNYALHVGDSFRITVIDETTDALGIVHVQVVR